MPTIRLFYPNCNCCSGSGSSGSGSGCPCGFFSNMCAESPVFTECKTQFNVTVRVNFSGCGSTPFGSCSTGSSGSAGGGPETGGDFEPTGSSSGSDCTICPDCCSLVSSSYSFALTCYESATGQWALISDGVIDPTACAGDGLNGDSGSCLGPKPDACRFFQIFSNGSSLLTASFGVAIDNGMFYGFTGTDTNPGCPSSMQVDSCNPLQITGTMQAMAAGGGDGNGGLGFQDMPCFGPCLFPDGVSVDNINERYCCISITFTITEA